METSVKENHIAIEHYYYMAMISEEILDKNTCNFDYKPFLQLKTGSFGRCTNNAVYFENSLYL